MVISIHCPDRARWTSPHLSWYPQWARVHCVHPWTQPFGRLSPRQSALLPICPATTATAVPAAAGARWKRKSGVIFASIGKLCRLAIVVVGGLSLVAGGCDRGRTAQQAFEAGNYASAYRQFRPLAEAGDRVAQNYLGVHYYLGLGVQRNWRQALQWYEKAAKQGEPGAQLNCGLMFQNGYGTDSDIGTAFMWYYASHRQGNAAAGRYLETLAEDNLLSPNQIDYAKLRAKPFIINPVVAGAGTAGSLFRAPLQRAEPPGNP